MNFYQIIKIVGFLLGTALLIAILGLMRKRHWRQRSETIFALFVFSTLMWNFFVFISIFCHYLYRGSYFFEQGFTSVAVVGLAFCYPLLLHTLLAFLRENAVRLPYLLHLLFLLGGYVPVFALLWSIWNVWQNYHFYLVEQVGDFVVFFTRYGTLVLLLGCIITNVLRKRAEHREEFVFYYTIAWVFAGIALVHALTYILPGRDLPRIGPYLELTSQLMVTLPPCLFAFYLYHYNYMEYVFKRSLIYAILGIFVIALYLFSIRPLGEGMEKKLDVNFRMIEGILVMILVFFFEPLKRKLQDFSNRLFFSENQYYRKMLSDISLIINQSSYLDLINLLDSIATTVSKVMKIRTASFIFFQRDGEKWKILESTIPLHYDANPAIIVEHIERKRWQVLNIYDLQESEQAIAREMKRIGAFTIIPMYHQNQVIGIFNLGKRLIRHQLLAEEEDMLRFLVNQLVIALENTRLVREKFALERRMYENEKLSSLGRLSASIAHEVKNPLSSIKTITQVMIEELPKEDANQESLQFIEGEIVRLSRVVDQLLRFARPHTYTLAEVKIETILGNVITLLKHEANRNHVEIHNRVATNGMVLHSDPDALIEIFFNLMHNSIQAMPEGGSLELSSSIGEADNGNPCLKILVKDNGPGIPPEDREKVFEPFYTTKQTGTGLGLTIVKQKLTRLRGKVDLLDSAVGAVFAVELPIDRREKIPTA